jgi:tRNA threonylcarbamoyladenosine biosynthesis protein TsaE
MTAAPQTDILIRQSLPDPAATAKAGAALAPLLRRGDVLALWGDLGAGKSTFARALIQRLSPEDEDVPSPTFTLVQTYPAVLGGEAIEIWHFDLYRLTEPEQAYDLAIEDAFQEGVSLIEWPDRLGYLLPPQRLDLILESQGEGRLLKIAGNAAWRDRLAVLAPGAA